MNTITKTFNTYTINELSEDAKEEAHNKYLESSEFFYYDECFESLKTALSHYDFKIIDYSIDSSNSSSRSYVDIESTKYINEYMGFGNEVHEELKGVRLFKYLQSEQYSKIWCKFTDKQINTLDGNCPFTGVCYDENFLDPINVFMGKIDTSLTMKGLMKQCINSLISSLHNEYEYTQSMEYFLEESEANERTYLEDGELYI